jgi:hypothetical protein
VVLLRPACASLLLPACARTTPRCCLVAAEIPGFLQAIGNSRGGDEFSHSFASWFTEIEKKKFTKFDQFFAKQKISIHFTPNLFVLGACMPLGCCLSSFLSLFFFLGFGIVSWIWIFCMQDRKF